MIKPDWSNQLGPSGLRPRKAWLLLTWALFAMIVGGVGCGLSGFGTPKGAVVGREGVYDYSPSVIQTGHVQQFWWCGEGHNPNRSSQNTDTILYASIDLSTKLTSKAVIVMGETPGAWDSVFTCNPKVIRGSFVNPLSDSQTYSYAMYYVATASPAGVANSIGVAFSNDGIKWKKYPQPIIQTTSQVFYGVGQPAVYNSDGKGGIWLFYEDANGAPFNEHYQSVSTDGVHFKLKGKLTTNGLDPHYPEANWGDMAYDSSTGYWYAVFNQPVRNPGTVKNVTERGQLGITLYRIHGGSLLSGATPWEQLKSFDTNVTGNESTFIGGFLRDQFGNVNIGPYPTIKIFTSFSNPRPAWDTSPEAAGKSGAPGTWDIGEVQWVPNSPLIPLNRYANKRVHEVTTGWVDPEGNFILEMLLGHLYESPQQGATQAFYGCKDDSVDYFVSTDINCEGKRYLGINGYGYSQAIAGKNLVPLYRCSSDHDHFVSKDPKCEGQTTDTLLGYAAP